MIDDSEKLLMQERQKQFDLNRWVIRALSNEAQEIHSVYNQLRIIYCI